VHALYCKCSYVYMNIILKGHCNGTKIDGNGTDEFCKQFVHYEYKIDFCINQQRRHKSRRINVNSLPVPCM
jgi:hypothetical protein